MVHEPAVLIEGVLFRARYLGSTQLVCEGRPNKATRMMQAQEAVTRIKVCMAACARTHTVVQAPDGERQPSCDVDLFISTEKIMVLNTDLQVSGLQQCNACVFVPHDLGETFTGGFRCEPHALRMPRPDISAGSTCLTFSLFFYLQRISDTDVRQVCACAPPPPRRRHS